MQITRRKLLAGVGFGALGIGVFSLVDARPAFRYYTYASDGDVDDRRVRAAWHERYNGAGLETHSGATPDFDAPLDSDTAPVYADEATDVSSATGPVLRIENALPRDEGTLVVGSELVDDGDSVPEPLDIWLQARLATETENGVNGPEKAACDTTPADGELDDHVLVELWRDGAPLRSCNGRRDFLETVESPIVARSPLSDAFGSGSELSDADGQRVIRSLQPGQTRCLVLLWPFRESSATAQGASVTFDLVSAGAATGAASPFTGGSA